MPQLRPTVGDEMKFQNWFAKQQQAKKTGKVDDPDGDPSYDWRGAYQEGAQPDASGIWPSQYKRGK
jgi:hypothetical protein